ncbi:MAG TPA: hemerythrin domain-containing protein [Alphaproteobacteria bacterium]|nr:hemerythrin domain-containing protein [Alphaproteobacteria bacterium]
MAQVIDQLVRDHRNMALLLDIIEEEIDAYRRDHVPDFDLLRVIAEYTLNYPDRVHHPRENLVLERLVERDPAASEAVGNLVAEHARLAELTLEFAKAMNAAANDVELSREWFDALAAEYLSANRRHMQVEETQFFPRALSVLTGDDWAEIDQLTARPNDPLFGDKVTKAYLFLHERILQSHG